MGFEPLLPLKARIGKLADLKGEGTTDLFRVELLPLFRVESFVEGKDEETT